ncbi:hypothetical protein [Clostridium saccharoperbutylacetonicum]|uniref:hypothetical protein n=1 Tax=Clostridium saccharoperbutylacetonicum TaxID=36745 RepID=UPI0039EBD497
MQLTSNYKLKKPDGTDVVNIDDFNSNADIIDNALKAHDTQLSDFVYQTAGGTGTALTVTIKGTLVNGYPITFIASANNSGAATTINGKKLYKPGTTTAPSLIKGKAYTVWYDLAGDCFFIKASAEGTATKDCVLAGYTFSNDNDTNIGGTIVSNGALGNSNFPINGTYNIPSGFTTGGVVKQNIPVKTAQTFVPSTVDQIINLGQYLSGNQVIKGDANFKSDNIPNGLTIFGITGTYIDYNFNFYNVSVLVSNILDYCRSTSKYYGNYSAIFNIAGIDTNVSFLAGYSSGYMKFNNLSFVFPKKVKVKVSSFAPITGSNSQNGYTLLNMPTFTVKISGGSWSSSSSGTMSYTGVSPANQLGYTQDMNNITYALDNQSYVTGDSVIIY